jgi:DNA-binding NtrC family response regulator
MRRIGLSPLRVRTLDDAVEKLKYGFFAAVLFDERRSDVDSLEFVLNVRDVDTAVPIVIIGMGSDGVSDSVLRSQHGVYRIPHFESLDQTAKALENILEGRRGR